ncbi:MAG: hypothetical protein ACT4PL_11930 [Phycisphaerales bacterium]
MKSLWIILSTLAVANLFGVLLLIAWLAGTDRLSRDRMERIRQILSSTVTAETAAVVDESAKKDAAMVQAKADEKAKLPPESAAEAIERQRTEDDAREQARIRRQRELEDLARQLTRDRQTLDEDRSKLTADRRAFDDLRAAAAGRAKDEQFQQALAALESQKPKDAYAVLRAMIDQKQQEQAITYLAAMEETKRAKVLTEFIKADDKLAAGLLEDLRAHGVAGAEKAAGRPASAP